MKNLRIDDEFVKGYAYQNNQEIEEVDMIKTVMIGSASAFANCKSLKRVYFGLDISRIGNNTFANCPSLTDVYFAITDEDKIIEIADDAFNGSNKDITFHIFATALKNKYLNNYARKHGYRVVGMI